MSRKASPEIAREAALAIVRMLREAGHTAFFAGGCVRDEVLGLDPTDYDVATDATPDRISALFRRTNRVGAAFGVVLVTLGASDGLAAQATVEVATFRSEGPYTDRRRPDHVSFSDPRADALRRDFTVNALFLDPIPTGSLHASLADAAILPHPTPGRGRIIDLVGGMADLRAKSIRAVGDPDARLSEDDLRALRAVRLSARLGFSIDQATRAAIQRHAGRLAGVSRERIGDEVRRMMAHPTRAAAVETLQALGLDASILSEDSKAAPPRVLAALGPATPVPTSLAAWALDRGLGLSSDRIASLVSRWRSAMCLSNDEAAGLRSALMCLMAIEKDWATMALPAQKRLAGLAEGFAEALALETARNPAAAERVRGRVSELEATRSGLAPPPILTGDDLVAAGHTPGPRFKAVLDAVYDAQLEGRVENKIAALELARVLGV
jgi:poly(A) polymerase